MALSSTLKSIEKNNKLKLGIDLTKDPVGKVLLRLCSPMLVGLATIMGSSVVIILALGKISYRAQAVYSLGVPMVMMLFAVAMGISIGCSAKVSQLWKPATIARAQIIARNGIATAFISAAIVGLFMFLIVDVVLDFILNEVDTIPLKEPLRNFLVWSFLTFPFLSVSMVSNGSMRGAGFSVLPSFTMVLFAVNNVFAMFIFCFGWFGITPMGIDGIGVATGVASIFSMFSTFAVMKWGTHFFDGIPPLRDASMSVKIFVKDSLAILKISLPATANQLLPPASILIFNYFLAEYGELALAGAGLISRVELLILAPLLTFPAAITAFCGQNYAAGRFDRIKEALNIIILFCVVFISLVLCILLINPYLISLMTDSYVAQDMIFNYFAIVGITLIFEGILLGISGLLNGLSYTAVPLFTNIARTFLFLIPLIILLRDGFQINGMFAAIAIANIASCLIISIFWGRIFRRLRSKGIPVSISLNS